MFQPFVNDAIQRADVDDLRLTDVQRLVQEATGLSVPTNVLRTLLKRAAKMDLVKREGGRYFRTATGRQTSDLSTRIQSFETAHQKLASHLLDFAKGKGETLETADDALAALMAFLDTNHIGIVLGQLPSKIDRTKASHLEQTVAAYVTKLFEERGPAYEQIDDVVRGLIVRNALLLNDIPTTKRHLHQLTIYLDTGVLLHALGYAGKAEQEVTIESLNVIRTAGARLRMFERTVNEIETILQVYERGLASAAGVRRLRDTELRRHFVGTHASSADIRQEIALLRTSIGKLGIRVEDIPRHVIEYTENERQLAEILRHPRRQGEADNARVWHDVDAIAAVMTLRAGKRGTRLSSVNYVFVSDSPTTVANAGNWFRRIYPNMVEPIVHFQSVTNSAWLIGSADASAVPMHQLVAVCQALLRPSPAVWKRFVAGLNELVSSGEVTDDESVAILANEFTRVRLGDIETEADVEANTIREIVERVRVDQQAPLRAELEAERRLRQERDRALVLERGRVGAERFRVSAILERWAGFLAAVACGMFSALLILGAILTIPVDWSVASGHDVAWATIFWTSVALFVGSSLASLFTDRFRIPNIHRAMKKKIEGWLRRTLFLG